jgi:hypothetical protein
MPGVLADGDPGEGKPDDGDPGDGDDGEPDGEGSPPEDGCPDGEGRPADGEPEPDGGDGMGLCGPGIPELGEPCGPDIVDWLEQAARPAAPAIRSHRRIVLTCIYHLIRRGYRRQSSDSAR